MEVKLKETEEFRLTETDLVRGNITVPLAQINRIRNCKIPQGRIILIGLAFFLGPALVQGLATLAQLRNDYLIALLSALPVIAGFCFIIYGYAKSKNGIEILLKDSKKIRIQESDKGKTQTIIDRVNQSITNHQEIR